MRIAQVSPLAESVPPRRYGGTERVVHWLTEELQRQGHDVTLYASGDSATSARLVSCSAMSLRRQGVTSVEDLAMHVAMADRVLQDAGEFDVIHWHLEHIHLPLCARTAFASVTTLHGRLDLPGLWPSYRRFALLPFVSLSRAQRAPLPWLGWRATVPHGMPHDLYDFSPSSQGYLVFLGRISPEKRCDRAIEIATRAGRELIIAAKVDPLERDYFDERIKPLLKRRGVDYVGEVGEREKRRLLAGADALLFPIDWPEPFGLVMIEALASGTPVIAWPHGAVPEVIDDGITGHLVTSIDDAVHAVERVQRLSRQDCRAAFEQRFSVERMATDYLRVYGALTRMETTHDLAAGATRRTDAGGDHSLPGPAGV